MKHYFNIKIKNNIKSKLAHEDKLTKPILL